MEADIACEEIPDFLTAEVEVVAPQAALFFEIGRGRLGHDAVRQGGSLAGLSLADLGVGDAQLWAELRTAAQGKAGGGIEVGHTG